MTDDYKPIPFTKEEAVEVAQGYKQMYDVGYLEGYVSGKRTRGKFANKEKVWILIKSECDKSFQTKFMRKIGDEINKQVKAKNKKAKKKTRKQIIRDFANRDYTKGIKPL